jgi:hypothetical protein
MRSLKIQIQKIDADRLVDSLEIAIAIVQNEFEGELELGGSNYSAAQLRNAIEDLQILRADTMLASRNAAKEAAPKSDIERPRFDPSSDNYNEFEHAAAFEP